MIVCHCRGLSDSDLRRDGLPDREGFCCAACREATLRILSSAVRRPDGNLPCDCGDPAACAACPTRPAAVPEFAP